MIALVLPHWAWWIIIATAPLVWIGGMAFHRYAERTAGDQPKDEGVVGFVINIIFDKIFGVWK
jgi:hypothetical protein